ncbi:MAG: hypothetical protein ACFFD4_29795 [Candidatus Odinarchaeota archaeon]
MKGKNRQELINVAYVKDSNKRKELSKALFHVEKETSEWFLPETIFQHCRAIDLDLHRLDNNLNSLEEIHKFFDRNHHSTFFSTVFHAFFLPKTQASLSLYLKDLKMDSLIILRTLIEYTAFALWADCVTRFKSSLFDFLWDPTALAGLDIHQMNSFDFNNRMMSIKNLSGARFLHQREFEEEFFSRGNPTDFFFFLLKPVCNSCQTQKKGLSYLFRRAKVWNLDEILGTTGESTVKKRKKKTDISIKPAEKSVDTAVPNEKSMITSNIHRISESKSTESTVEQLEEFSYSLNRFIKSMVGSAKSRRSRQHEKQLQEKQLAENEKEITRLKKLEESLSPSIELSMKQQPAFGSEHLKTCAFCQKEESSGAILQLPNFKLLLIWLQKIFPERRITLIKIKLAWTFLTENFSHFSTSINPDDKQASFDFHGRKINLFSAEGVKEVYEDLFEIMNFFLVYRERMENWARR